MAGKETPRQKMINMMYLIFIAMLALNMSKEVLSAFGTLTEELSETNVELQERNNQFMQGLEEKAREQEAKYLDLKLKADSIRAISSELYDYLENVKEGAYVSAEKQQIKRNDYEKLDKTTYFEQEFLNGAKLKPAGQEFMDKMVNYREEFNRIASSDPKLVSIADEVKEKFKTDDIKGKQGKPQSYLSYHYKGMPMIAAITKITLIQSTIKNIEAQLLSTMLEGKLKIEASLTNFDAIVVADKSSFFAGENFTGRIILGKNDPTLKADKVIINGNELDDESMQQGQTILSFPAGGIGTKKIEGEFQFTEEGELISIPVTTSYEVVPRPNKAIISADKMKVVYRGVKNPISVSIPGIADNRLNVSAPGMQRISGANYIVDLSGSIPQALQGKDSLSIRAVGQLEGGAQIISSEVFRIKGLPRPIATIAGNVGLFEFGKEDLSNTSLRARFDESFAYDLPVVVRSFDISVPGRPPITNRGRRMRDEARDLISQARQGDIVTISGIKVDAQGSEYILKDPLPLSVLITN